jgi:hypothetical protein
MFYIRNAGDAKAALSNEEHLALVKNCELYIGKLKGRRQTGCSAASCTQRCCFIEICNRLEPYRN